LLPRSIWVIYIIILFCEGKVYSFHIVANEVGTTADFREMSHAERNCKLPRENENLKMFKSYSKSSCEHECAIGKATNICLCKPWNIPRVSGENTSYCDMLGNYCFYIQMIMTGTYDNCNCEDDCELANYNVFQSNSPIKDKKLWYKY